MEGFKTCTVCKLDKNLSFFNKKSKSKDGLQNICKECCKIRSDEHYVNNKESRKLIIRQQKVLRRSLVREHVFAYLKLHPCVDCGEGDIIVLDFDHISDNKRYNVSTMLAAGYQVETVMSEIEKCEVRCANCHRRKTAKQLGWAKLDFIGV